MDDFKKSDGDPNYEAPSPNDRAVVKNQPPFPKISSSLVCAVIASFMGYQDYVKDLMQRLSKKTRGYYIGHKDIINGFATEWTAQTEEIEFGEKVYDIDSKYPFPSELRRISKSKGHLKLSAIVYKCVNGNGPISAIGLEFADGNKSPIFETESAKTDEELKKIVVDPSYQIEKIQMYMNKEHQMHGLILFYKQSPQRNSLLTKYSTIDKNDKWYQRKDSKIIEANIPEGMEIIGIRCATGAFQNQIPRLSFITWKPRHYWEAFNEKGESALDITDEEANNPPKPDEKSSIAHYQQISVQQQKPVEKNKTNYKKVPKNSKDKEKKCSLI